MSSDEKRPLGRIALQRKLVPRELAGAVREQEAVATPRSAARPVIEDRDDEAEALLALAERSGAQGLDLRQLTIALDHLDVVPREVAETLRILPVLLLEDRLYLAMADPHDRRAIDEIEFVTAKTVHAFIAVPGRLLRTIAAAYDAKARGDRELRGARAG
jgi:hypothetical protein